MALNDAFSDGLHTGRRAGLEALQTGDQAAKLDVTWQKDVAP